MTEPPAGCFSGFAGAFSVLMGVLLPVSVFELSVLDL
jgi:hypothetical protein